MLPVEVESRRGGACAGARWEGTEVLGPGLSLLAPIPNFALQRWPWIVPPSALSRMNDRTSYYLHQMEARNANAQGAAARFLAPGRASRAPSLSVTADRCPDEAARCPGGPSHTYLTHRLVRMLLQLLRTYLATYLPCLAGCTAPSPFTRTTHPQPRGDQRTPESSSLPTPCSVHAPPSPQAASALPMQVSPISGLTFIMHEAVEMDSPIRPVGYIHLARSLAWVPAGRRGP